MVEILKEIYDKDRIGFQEEVVILMFSFANQLIGYFKLSAGGMTSTVVDTRIIFSVALKSLATNIIISHNHPSGNMMPSTQDDELTKRINEGGKILDITLLDHIIVSPQFDYFSYADEGRL